MLELHTNIDKLKRVSRMMKVLSNQGRLLVVDLLLSHGSLTVGEIAEHADLSQSNASQHLKSLETAGVLGSERKGKSISYSISHPGIKKLMSCIGECVDCHI